MDFGGDDEEEVEEGAPAWMATFSDMATLLLTFFVLLLSFANMDVVQFHEMLGSVREAFGVQFEVEGRFQARSGSLVSIAEGGNPNQSVVEEEEQVRQIQEALEEAGLGGQVDVEATRRGISLRIRDGVLFGSGSADLSAGGPAVLDVIGVLAQELEHQLAIEGHTDDRPIATRSFPSNWELSAARATAVLRYLAAHDIARERMSIAGYADTRPIGDNRTDEGRAQNRRVEFIFLQERADAPLTTGDARAAVRGDDTAADDGEARGARATLEVSEEEPLPSGELPPPTD
jgi:chemotaxis protein MotB